MSSAPFAVLFDMDGVLIDSEPAHKAAHLVIRKRYGFTEDEVNRAWEKGSTLRHYYQEMQAIHPFTASFDDFADELLAEVFAHLEANIQGADPDLLLLLRELRQHKVPVAVGTSALRRSSARKLAIVKLHDEFDVIVTSEDVVNAKPAPDVYLLAAQKVGVAPDRCIVIDDTKGGVAAGKAAGMKVIGYSKYASDRQTLAQADLIVDDYGQLSYDRLLQLVSGKG